MWQSVSKAIGALTSGDDAVRQYDIAAERIQSALLNISVPVVRGLDVGVRAEPARLVGGDYIDLFSRGDHLLFGLGDASGKSLGAAINALMLRYLLRGLVQALGDEQLTEIVRHANDVVAQDLEETDYFITLLLGVLHPDSGDLKIVNAGHEPPLILREGAADIEVMSVHGIVLGVDRRVSYPIQETTLEVGDRVIIYTDGLTEASNTRGELFTIARLREAFLEHRYLGAQELADRLFDDVKAYSDDNLRDDTTILVIRRFGQLESASS
jgi:sigma-B regulation protein RsbU (phosphoserine phosphatase)